MYVGFLSAWIVLSGENACIWDRPQQILYDCRIPTATQLALVAAGRFVKPHISVCIFLSKCEWSGMSRAQPAARTARPSQLKLLRSAAETSDGRCLRLRGASVAIPCGTTPIFPNILRPFRPVPLAPCAH